MFTRKNKASKNDLIGLFRNIFASNHSKDSVQSLHGTSKNKDILKPPFRRKIKLPSFKVTGSKPNRKNNSLLQMSPERWGLYNPIKSPDIGFEEVDLSVSVSSILKNPHTDQLSHKKRLRFLDESNSCNMSNSTDVETLKSSESVANDNIVSEIDPIESDVHYYKKMKNKLIKRNEFIPYKKSKLNDSNQTLPSLKLEEKIIEQHNELLQFDTFDDSQLHLLFGNNVDTQTIDIGIFPAQPHCLRKWVSDNDFKLKDENIQLLSPFDLTAQSESKSSDSASVFSENRLYSSKTQHNLCSKVQTLKKYKNNRFDPMSKNESCSAAMLRNQRSNSDKMSWAQAENLI